MSTLTEEIIKFYRNNNFNYRNSIGFDDLLNSTSLSRDQLDRELRILNNKGYLQDIIWDNDVCFRFFLSNLGKRTLGLP